MGDRSGRTRRGSGDSRGGEAESLSALLDRFTTVDEKLEETNDALRTVVRTNQAIAQALSSLAGEDVDIPSQNDLPLVADAVIQPQLADGVTEPGDYDGNTEAADLNIPRDGVISQVFLSFPAGANQSIGVGLLGRDEEALIPYGPSGVRYVALDDKTVDFNLDYDVDKGESVTARFINERVAETEQEIDELTAYASAIVVVTEEV